MAVRRFSTSSIRTGVKTSRFWDQSTVIINPAFESIATVTVGSGGAADITFTSIPSTYAHLQIRYNAKSASDNIYQGNIISCHLNSDTNANYKAHRLVGDGSSASSSTWGDSARALVGIVPDSSSTFTNMFGGGVIDFLDYTNTNKNTTIRTLSGTDNNGSGAIELTSALWLNTSAVNTIKLYLDGENFAQHSHFALYGIKGA